MRSDPLPLLRRFADNITIRTSEHCTIRMDNASIRFYATSTYAHSEFRDTRYDFVEGSDDDGDDDDDLIVIRGGLAVVVHDQY